MGKLYITTTLFDEKGKPVSVISDVVTCASQTSADRAIKTLEESDTNWEDANGVFSGSQATRAVYCSSL